MAAYQYITEGGYYPEIILEGDISQDGTDGLVIDAPGQIVVIGYLSPRYCRVPLIVKNVGKLICHHFNPAMYWGDTANLRASNLYFDYYTPQDIQPQRRSYEEYHHDLIFQAYALDESGQPDPCGVIEHIHINHLEVSSDLEHVNGLMLSERNQYQHFHIGTQSLNIEIEAPYWLNANTLSDSIIGGGESHVGSLSGRFDPSILLSKRKDTEAVTQRCLAMGVPYADLGAYPDDGMVVL